MSLSATLLQDEAFARAMIQLVRTQRKNRGCGIFIFQEADSFVEAEYCNALLQNCKTQIFFHGSISKSTNNNNTAKKFRLTEKEAQFCYGDTPKTGGRPVLIKRQEQTAESYFVDVDFSKIDNLINGLTSNKEKYKNLKNMNTEQRNQFLGIKEN